MIEVRLYLFTFYAAQRKHNGSKFRGLEILVKQKFCHFVEQRGFEYLFKVIITFIVNSNSKYHRFSHIILRVNLFYSKIAL